MLNKAMIIGRLGRDPELRYSNSGTAMCNLNVATDESYTDKDGNRVEKTEWHRVTVFQRMAETCSQYLTKGSLVYVEGRLQTRKWTDQSGAERYTTEIRAERVQFLDKKSDRSGDDQDAGYQPRQQPAHRRAPAQRQSNYSDYGSPFPSEAGSPFPSEASGMDDSPF